MILPRLYPILDTEVFERRKFPLLEAARVILESGVHLVQWRCKGVIGRDQLAQVDSLAALCSKHSATLVVNDRADVAMLAGAHGVHLGQEDLPPAMVRRLLGAGALLGFSTHNLEQFMAGMNEPVDYLALGPIFPTRSKTNPDPPVGIETLGRCAGLTAKPVVAIGGVTRAEARQVLAAGAASVAVIGDLVPDPCDAGAFRQRIHEWLGLLQSPMV